MLIIDMNVANRGQQCSTEILILYFYNQSRAFCSDVLLLGLHQLHQSCSKHLAMMQIDCETQLNSVTWQQRGSFKAALMMCKLIRGHVRERSLSLDSSQPLNRTLQHLIETLATIRMISHLNCAVKKYLPLTDVFCSACWNVLHHQKIHKCQKIIQKHF